MSLAEPGRRRDRGADDVDELARGSQRRLAPPAHDGPRDLARVALLAEAVEDVGELALARLVHQVLCRQIGAGIHAHVERRVDRVREAALGPVELHRRDAEVEEDRVRAHAVVGELPQHGRELAVEQPRLRRRRADAILLDLGVSSMQLDRPERGFSYAVDAPLDMRMDPTQEESARDLVNTWSERDLVTIFRRYGEERYAKQIARAIVRRRKEQPFERTGELVDTIKASIPAPARFGEGHPAKRVFQAIRIAVNDELNSLEV